MRLLRLDLSAFGPFTDEHLDLSQGNLHLIYGPNEAGKSTALRAITGLFYGIPGNTGDAHLHPMNKLRVGGTLALDSGDQLDLVRRKGRKGTLLDPSGNVLDDAVMQRALAGVGRDLFLTMFGLDHRTLRDGAEALLAGGGDVGETLFDAGGARGVHAVLSRLRSEADGLYKTRGQTPKLNEAIKAFKEAKKRTKLEAISGEAHTTQKQGILEAEAEREALQAKRHELRAEQSRLQRSLTVLPDLAKRKELRERRKALGEIATLAVDAATRRLAAQSKLEQATRDRERLEQELTQLETRRSELVDMPALAELDEAVVNDIQDRLGSHRGAATDLPRREGALREMEQELREMLRELNRSVPLEQLESLRVDRVTAARIEELAQTHGGIAASARHLKQALATQRLKLEVLDQRLSSGSDVPCCDQLRDAIKRARSLGDIDEAIGAAVVTVADATQDLERRARSLGIVGNVDIPSRETIGDFETRWSKDKREHDQLAAQLDEVEQRRIELERERVALDAAGDVPTEQQLQAAREKRQARWSAVKRVLSAADGLPDATTLPGATTDYESAVTDADTLADRLRREADRVAQRARLLADLEACASLKAHRAQQIEEKLARQAATAAQWHALWPAGVEAKEPSAMRAWHDDFRALESARAALQQSELQLDVIRQRRERHRRALTLELDKLGAPYASDLLAALLDQSERVADKLGREREERKRLTEERRVLDAETAQLGRQHHDVAEQLAEWQAAWEQSIAPLGLPTQASVEQARVVLTTLARLFEKAAQADQMRGRIEGMVRDAALLEDNVFALMRQHLPDVERLPVTQTADLLLSTWRKARHDAIERARLAGSIGERKLALDAAATQQRACDQQLTELMKAARADSIGQLEEAEGKSDQARRIDEELSRVEDALYVAGEGMSLEQLDALAVDVDVDHVKTRLDELHGEIDELNDDIERLSDRIGGWRLGLQRNFEEHAGASAAADDMQAHLAAAHKHAHRYTCLRIAAGLLAKEIERYREENQGPILRRASELFPRLTLDRYRELRVDFSDRHAGSSASGNSDDTELRCVRADGKDLGIAELSDGARDQLYLALRLASLERYATRSEVVPLVFDDVLIHFDDERARAALTVIAELEGTFQLLFFTHHARLVDLATDALGDRLQHHLLRVRAVTPPLQAIP